MVAVSGQPILAIGRTPGGGDCSRRIVVGGKRERALVRPSLRGRPEMISSGECWKGRP